MNVKWVCRECGTVNTCEKGDRMVCFVCGRARAEEKLTELRPPAVHGGKGEAMPPIPAPAPIGERLRESVREWLDRIFPAPAAGEGETVDWTVSPGPRESREAYLTAVPVRKAPAPVRPPLGEPEKRRAVSTAAETGTVLPWPEHEISLAEDRLRAAGCVKLTRAEQGGVRGYSLHYKNGTDQFLTRQKMTMMGYARRR